MFLFRNVKSKDLFYTSGHLLPPPPLYSPVVIGYLMCWDRCTTHAAIFSILFFLSNSIHYWKKDGGTEPQKTTMATTSDVREILELEDDSQEFMTKDALFNTDQKKVKRK